MLFTPTNRIDILQENDYAERMIEIESALSECKNAGFYRSQDGAKLYYEYFLAENSRGNIVVVHGFTEFLQKYYEMCWYFLQMGFNVFMYDQRGHGLSERIIQDLRIVHIERFEQYVDDLDAFISNIVAPNGENKPVYIYAHSMGGGVAAEYLCRENSKVQKCVLSSAMISPTTYGVPAAIVRRLVRRDAVRKGWNVPFRYAASFSENPDFHQSNDLSRARFDHQLALRIAEPKYQSSAATNRWVYEALGVQGRLMHSLRRRKMRTDLLIICAGQDKTVRVSAQKRMARRIPEAKLVCFENARHTIYNGTPEMIERYVDLTISFFAD